MGRPASLGLALGYGSPCALLQAGLSVPGSSPIKVGAQATQEDTSHLHSSVYLKSTYRALAGWLSWLENYPVYQ